MNFISRLLKKRPEDFLERGDRLFVDGCYFEARTAFEDGLRLVDGRSDAGEQQTVFRSKIEKANHALAELNLTEAEDAQRRGDSGRALEHLELAKTLTADTQLREKADKLLLLFAENSNETSKLESPKSCSGCSGASESEAVHSDDLSADTPLSEYFDLLIQHLPPAMYARYAGLGEKFACMYVASCNNNYDEALRLLEEWSPGADSDIFFYEKGMILFRLGKTAESEVLLRRAMMENAGNSLAQMGLSLLMIEAGRIGEAAVQLDGMISGGILAEQASMLRAAVYRASGDFDRAIDLYSGLLATPLAKQAAEGLHDVLVECGRPSDAEFVYKKYLKGCCH